MASHTEVLHAYERTAPIIAVRGNVDEEASMDELPEDKVVILDGWRILITHIAGTPAPPVGLVPSMSTPQRRGLRMKSGPFEWL